MSADSTEPSQDNTEAVTLAGLRRLVLHARDGLRASSRVPAYGWNDQEIKAHTAHVLALHVLTLVADCLPGDAVTPDEFNDFKREMERQLAAAERKVRETEDHLTKVSDARAEADELASGWQDDYVELEALLCSMLGVEDAGERDVEQYRELVKAARTAPAATAHQEALTAPAETEGSGT